MEPWPMGGQDALAVLGEGLFAGLGAGTSEPATALGRAAPECCAAREAEQAASAGAAISTDAASTPTPARA
jgi:hypothetical protein